MFCSILEKTPTAQFKWFLVVRLFQSCPNYPSAFTFAFQLGGENSPSCHCSTQIHLSCFKTNKCLSFCYGCLSDSKLSFWSLFYSLSLSSVLNVSRNVCLFCLCFCFVSLSDFMLGFRKSQKLCHYCHFPYICYLQFKLTSYLRDKVLSFRKFIFIGTKHEDNYLIHISPIMLNRFFNNLCCTQSNTVFSSSYETVLLTYIQWCFMIHIQHVKSVIFSFPTCAELGKKSQ